MQFQMQTQVFGCNKMTMDGKTYCSVFTGQPATDPAATRGLEVTKIGADPVVFDQLQHLKPGDDVEFLAVLKRAAGGKSQPFLVGVVPQSGARQQPKAEAK